MEKQKYPEKMMVVPEPAPGTRVVMSSAKAGEPCIRGEGRGAGPVTLLCGACEKPIVLGLSETVRLDPTALYRCECGAVNLRVVAPER